MSATPLDDGRSARKLSSMRAVTWQESRNNDSEGLVPFMLSRLTSERSRRPDSGVDSSWLASLYRRSCAAEATRT